MWRSYVFLRGESMFYLDEFSANVPRMLCASLAGFVIPYYIALLGIAGLKLETQQQTIPATELPSSTPFALNA